MRLHPYLHTYTTACLSSRCGIPVNHVTCCSGHAALASNNRKLGETYHGE